MLARPIPRAWLAGWSLARQFLAAHLVIVLVGVLVTGAWIANQIEGSVLDRTAGVTALYVNSVISPRLQGLAASAWLSPDEVAQLDQLVGVTELGQGVVVVKIWSPDGHVLYSPDRGLIGRQFPVSPGLAQALQGQVSAEMSQLDEAENEHERARWSHLIEVYAPVRRDVDGQLIAVNEFYLLPDQLEAEIGTARVRAWAIVGAFGAALYLLTGGIVKRGSDTIQQQRARLEQQVGELGRLHGRVLQAASRTTALHEQALRRISADLHDGPGQVLALALLRLEALRPGSGDHADFDVVRDALSEALKEIRAISSGLRLPELEQPSLAEVVERTIGDHERRAGVTVQRRLEHLPDTVPLAVKIALLRTLQEALSNATRHAGGQALSVRVWTEAGQVRLEVADRGPGFDPEAVAATGRLGLAGMRERAELLGGRFQVWSEPGAGTCVHACWPLSGAGAAA
jgi:signal transduction histidine kinase